MTTNKEEQEERHGLPLTRARSVREKKWCPGWESNPHEVKPRRILSPQRLPFRHPGVGTKNLANARDSCNTTISRGGLQQHRGISEPGIRCYR
jgi:hypothetical protein